MLPSDSECDKQNLRDVVIGSLFAVKGGEWMHHVVVSLAVCGCE